MQSSTMRTSLAQTQQGPHWIMLRLISALFKIVAILLLLGNLALGVLAVIAMAQQASKINLPSGLETSPLLLSITSVGGFLLSLFLYAFADFIMLLIAIEKNTRFR